MKQLESLRAALMGGVPGLELHEGEPLARYTSFRIGGPAALLALPKTDGELEGLLRLSAQAGVRPILLGAGTNVLAPDEGLDTLVIRTRDGLGMLRALGGGRMEAGCGATLARAAAFALEHGLQGLEFAHGIPGTVGGGVLMNAGAYGGELKQVVRRTTVLLPDGTRRDYVGQEQSFGYRTSAFSQLDGAIVSAELQLEPGDPETIRARMAELAAKRRASQPLELPSAGSAFKRPKSGYAAALIDQAGLKGFRIGGAAVSEKHAGFVVNLGGATAKDVRTLLDEVRRRVFDASGVLLEPEIRLLGAEKG